MSEPGDLDEGPRWDDVVDVICVGTAAGVLAYGLCCVESGLDVLFVAAPGHPIADLTGFLTAMTEDIDAATPEADVPVNSARPYSPPSGRGAVLETFVGHHLRDWSSRCAASSFGVVFTQIPQILTPMRTETGESVTAAVLDGCSELPVVDDELAALIFDEGRIAGVELADGDKVAATGGLALPVGPALERWPTVAEGFEVAVVGRPFGRFARLERWRR